MDAQTNVTSTGQKIRTVDITVTAAMAALVFLGTYIFKIPTISGYVHLGDCMILLTVALFGMKKGAIAGAIGGGLSDFIGGYFYWVVPTLLIKCMWAIVMGLIMHKVLKDKKGSFLIGAIAGGVLHIIAYTLVRVVLYGGKTAIIEIPALAFQTGAGIVIGFVIYMLLKKIRCSRSSVRYGQIRIRKNVINEKEPGCQGRITWFFL